MRTTLDIPEDLMTEAASILGYKSKTDVVVFSLRELIRRKKIEDLKNLAGKVKISIDIDRHRRRSKK